MTLYVVQDSDNLIITIASSRDHALHLVAQYTGNDVEIIREVEDSGIDCYIKSGDETYTITFHQLNSI